MTFNELIKKYSKIAKSKSKEVEAIKILVLELSGMDGAKFLLNINENINPDLEEKIINSINEYIELNHPIQHILGYSYFYGYKFIVSKDVLIPRPETEELVSNILCTYDEVFDSKEVKVVDVGTGSGAIAIALAKEEPKMTLTATDISFEALEVAKKNASLIGANVEFMQGDMLKPLIEKGLKFDILVSNPPYIQDEEYVEDIVKDNEPHVALFGGADGMKFYDIILKDASKILNNPSIIAFEHSYSKKKEMLELANKYFPNAFITDLQDMNGKDRMLIIINK